MYAVGKIDSLEEVKDWIDIVHHHVPNKENTAIYLEMFYMYERLYNRLKEEFDCIALSNVKIGIGRNGSWDRTSGSCHTTFTYYGSKMASICRINFNSNWCRISNGNAFNWNFTKDPGIIDSIKLGLGNTLGFLAIVLALERCLENDGRIWWC